MADSKLWRVVGLVLTLLTIDRATKLFSLQLAQRGEEIFLAPSINAGWLFGFINQSSITIVVIIFLLLLATAALALAIKKNQPILILGWGLTVVGGASNFWDRWWYGCVIDFINFANLTQFNLADLYLIAGLVTLVLKFKSAYVR